VAFLVKFFTQKLNNMILIQRGMIGQEVTEVQLMLNTAGANPILVTDGIFGYGTERAVIAFQNSKGLIADGIVGEITYKALLEATGESDLPAWIKRHHLDTNNYMPERTKKIAVCLHHTVSGGNPYRVVDIWKQDSRGTVATEFLIGRKLENGDTKYDGTVVQAFPSGYWAHHVLTTRTGLERHQSDFMNKSIIGIELCSWGALQKKEGKFYDLSGSIEIPESEVCILERPFRTFKYWHRFTDAQLESLERLLIEIQYRDHIIFSDKEFEPEVVNHQWFELDYNALFIGIHKTKRRKLMSHTTVEYGKFDVFPQPELIELIKKVCNYE
jgi:hypothetical protein